MLLLLITSQNNELEVAENRHNMLLQKGKFLFPVTLHRARKTKRTDGEKKVFYYKIKRFSNER